MSRLQQCFLDTICKLQISQEKDTTTIVESVNGCKILLLQGQSQLDQKSTDKDTLSKELQSVQQKIKTLQEEKDSLKSQLQIEKENVTLLKCQYDDLNNHSRNLLVETRKELEKLVSSTNSELDFNANRLIIKNQELQTLHESEHNLRLQLDKAIDEILNLKSQISSSIDISGQRAGTAASKSQHQTKEQVDQQSIWKPSVLLIGTSNIRGINESKLSSSIDAIKEICFTLDKTNEYILGYNPQTPPAVVVLHILTNDLKTKNPQNCACELFALISIIQEKWCEAKCLISLATPRRDDMMHHTNGQIVNALIKQNFYGKHYTELTKVQLIEHNNMYYEGQANEELLQNDLYHLNDKGVSYLASNIKQAVHQILNISLPPTRRPRSQSRNRRGRGRGRGRGDTK